MFWLLLEIVLYCNLFDEFMHVDQDQIHNYTTLTQSTSLEISDERRY